MEPDGGEHDVAPVPLRPPGGSSRAKWLGVVAGFAVLVGVVVLQRHSGNAPAAAVTPTATPVSSTLATTTATMPTPTTPPTIAPTTPTAPTTTAPTTTAPTTTAPPASSTPPGSATPTGDRSASTIATLSTVVPAAESHGWEIIGLATQGLIRIDPVTGRVTQVTWPDFVGAQGSFQAIVTGRDRTLLISNAPGSSVVVSDSGPVVKAPGLLNTGGTILPGPDPDHLWVWGGLDTADSDRVLTLVDWQGRAAGPTITLPSYLLGYGVVEPDGAGYPMAMGVGGMYELRPDSIRLITHGTVLATGPTGYLAYECGDAAACQAVLIDRADRSRRVVPGVPAMAMLGSQPGLISPDGTRAVYVQVTMAASQPKASLVSVELPSGATHEVPAYPDLIGRPEFGFSADGGMLALLLADGDVGVLDVRTGVVHQLGVTTTAGSYLTVLVTRVSR